MKALLRLFLYSICLAGVAAAEEWTTDLQWGGAGGVYFLAEAGDLWVDVEKADLNRTGRPTFLRAILFGPDRRVIDQQTLPDDGRDKGSGTGPVQRVRLSANVATKGVYGLNVTISTDRYGENVAWGFRTNCPHYLVETSRGHRDAPHEEPLVLLSPGKAGDVFFMPRKGEFAVEAAELPAGSPALVVYNPEGTPVGELTASEKGEAAAQFDSAEFVPSAPWRLHLPQFKGTLHIDGATRWPGEDEDGDLSLWTPQRESWFPFAAYRWLLTPYSRLAYNPAGAEGSVAFRVYNNGPAETAVLLAVEFPEGRAWPVELSQREISVSPQQAVEVSLRYRVPEEGESWQCHLRATPAANPEFSTYSTFELRRGTAPAEGPLDTPIVLKPYRHENELFGYLPDYPVENQVYFDSKNRPYAHTEDGVALRRGDAWEETGLESFRRTSTKIAFDERDGVYLLGEKGGSNALLYSSDGGKTFATYPVPGSAACDIEQFSGHNVPSGPPPFVRFTLTQKDPELFWRRLNDLDLFLPEKDSSGGIFIPPPVRVSAKCIGYSGHSGMPSSVVSRGSRVHVVWAEATEPDEKAPGVPTFGATYDRDTGTLSAPALIGYGPPANDVHNTPCITMDSRGYLHVLIGTHGRTFQYARSLEPNTAAAGWTESEDLGPDLRQTYVGMVCGRDDTLHVVFRLWRNDTAYFPASEYACLAHMSKRPGEGWSEPRLLVAPPFSEYSVFYHRLTIDREGRLYLSYDYFSTYWFYRTDHVGSRRALLTSPDAGKTWQLATDEGFQGLP